MRDEIKDNINENINVNDDIKNNDNKDTFKKNFIVSAITCLLTLLFITFVAQGAVVSGSSMYPTLEDGDVVVMEKITEEYDRYDIIITKSDNIYIIKRVIGLPGETVQIIDNDIYINDKKITDAVDIEMEFYGIASEKITLKDNEYYAKTW